MTVQLLTLLLCLVMYGLLLALAVAAWLASNHARTVVTPFALFACFEMISVWPATLVSAGSGTSRTGAYPVLVAGLAFGACLLGFGLAMAARRYSSAQPDRFRALAVKHRYPDLVYALAILVVASMLAAVGIYLYQGWPPLVEGVMALGHGSDGLSSAIDIVAAGRQEATKGHYLGEAYRGQGVILELMQDGWPYLVMLASLVFLVTRRRRWLLVALGLCALMVFFVAGSGQRWQILAAMMVVAIGLLLVGRPRTEWIVALGAAMVLIYSGMSLLNSTYEGFDQNGDAVESFISLGASRIALANGLHDVDSINLVDDGSLDWGMGSIHLQKFVSSIPGIAKDLEPFSARLALLLNPDRPDTDTTYASSTYLGWLYVDFGLPGTVLVFFLIGVLLACSQDWLFRSASRDLLDLPARALIIFYLGELALDSPASVIASLVIVALLYISLRALTAVLAAPLRHAYGGWVIAPVPGDT